MAKKGGASRRRFRVLPTVLLAAAILLVPTAVYAWGRSSSSFDITNVTVGGTRLVPKARATRLLTDDFVGRNLFTVTAADVRKSLASFAYVEDVSIDRDFPHTLRVTVIEHDPAVYALAPNGWFVVAGDGFVIAGAGRAPAMRGAAKTATSPSPGASPAGGPPTSTSPSPGASASPAHTPGPSPSTGSSADLTQVARPPAALAKGPPHAALRLPALAVSEALQPGQTLSSADTRAALEVLAALPASLRGRVTVVQVRAMQDVALQLSGGLTVRWGDGQRPLAKRLSLAAVLAAYRQAGKRPTFIDVSVPDRVLARPTLK